MTTTHYTTPTTKPNSTLRSSNLKSNLTHNLRKQKPLWSLVPSSTWALAISTKPSRSNRASASTRTMLSFRTTRECCGILDLSRFDSRQIFLPADFGSVVCARQKFATSRFHPLILSYSYPCSLLFGFSNSYESTVVDGHVVMPVETKMQFRTERKVPKVSWQEVSMRPKIFRLPAYNGALTLYLKWIAYSIVVRLELCWLDWEETMDGRLCTSTINMPS